jgi:hypothetical protein
MRASKQPARSRQALRRNTFRPRLELLEHRLAPAGLGLVEVGPAVTFDPAAGSLAIRGGADGAAVQVGTSGNGAVAVSINGQASFDPALAGLSAATLRQISLLGGPGDSLTLDGVTAAGDLAVQSDGAVTLAGDVGAAGRLTVSAASLDVQGTAHAVALLLNATGTLNVEATGGLIADNGGSITAAADYFVNVGQVRADGASGGQVSVTARDDLNAGTVSAAGSAGAGGRVQIAFTESYIDTVTATTTASGTAAGGLVSVNGGSGGRLFSSGRFEAAGTSGGSVDLFGQDVLLVGAGVDASGAGGGGRVRVGGDFHGSNPAVPNAQTVYVGPATSLRADGAGGQLVVWSEQSTAFGGAASALGGGFIEVSSRGQLTFGGTADPGAGGTLLLDPKFIVISAGTGGQFPQFNLVNPGTGGAFGTAVVTLATGNIVVTDPKVNSNKGAVYLFNGQTGALISTLAGSTGGDSAGSGGVVALPNGNYLVLSPLWSSSEGAVTWGSGTAGTSGAVSASNSLVGSTSSDRVGSGGVTALSNGNYVVSSPLWNADKGAATWGGGAAGVSGAVTSANSLVGSTGGISPDEVSSGGVTALANGNYVVSSPHWNNNKGAATWGSGTAGIAGTISSSDSLVGSDTGSNGDQVSSGGVTALPGGNYVVASPLWSGSEGAATWGGGASGVLGVLSSANSLVGTTTSDKVSSGGVVVLTNGNYVVNSPNGLSGKGAVTWGSGATGVSGAIAATNSLVGSLTNDAVGSGGVTALTNGNYVVCSPRWNGGGAATWGSGTSGISGTVSAANSVIGTTQLALVGNGGAVALTNGNYVVISVYGLLGAVTWENGSAAATGTVSSANSLVGTSSGAFGDQVGSGGVAALANGNYVVSTVGQFTNHPEGAVTWGSGTTGISGALSTSNSLFGSSSSDAIGGGGIIALPDGDYVISSPSWNSNEGAATWESGSAPVTGALSATNSLVGATSGSSGDKVSSGGVKVLPNGNYVVLSPAWSISKGAATWGSGTGGTVGAVSASNSVVGTTGGSTGDQVGSGGMTALPDGNFVVSSPKWNNVAGAVTWEFGDTGTTLDGQGNPDAANSLLGAASNAGLGPVQLGAASGSFVAAFSTEGPGRVTVGSVNPGGPSPGQLPFNYLPSSSVTVNPQFLQHLLAAGTNVVFQANDDITVSSPVTVSTSGTAGNLTLQAGRSVLLNAGIKTAGGNLTLIANDSVADGVVDAQRDAGKGAITEGAGISLDAGAGTLSVDLKATTDTTNHAQGVVTLLTVAGASVKLSAVSPLGVTVNGSTPGDGTTAGTYTQTSVTGPINLNGAALAVTHKVATTKGETFTIVHTTGGITGTFAGLPEGATVAADDGTQFTITYQANGGDDVVLTQIITATHFVVSAPTTATAGTAFTFTVKAEDASGNIATNYTGTVHFTSSDPQAVLPSDYTFTAADAGTHTFTTGATLKTAGNQTLTATDTVASKLTGTSGSINVSPAVATHFGVSAPTTATAGTAFTFKVKALDAYNNTATGYAGTVHFTSSDPAASLPADTTLTNGSGSFSATLKTAGSRTLTATDSVTSSLTGTSGAVSVSPAAASHFGVSAPTTATAGAAFTFTVTAFDPFNNTATGYAGTVHFTSSDAQASLPANATLTNGAGSFSATLKTAGNQTLTATDTATSSITGTSNAIFVSRAAASHFSVSAPAKATAGTSFALSVTAQDPFGNTATAYTGTVHFTSSDPAASLPPDSTLTNGAGSFNATLNTGGSQTVTATDTATSSITGTSNAIDVIALSLSSNSVLELRPVGTLVGTLSTTEAGSVHTFTYTLVSGTGSDDNASFTISGNKLLTADAFDFNSKSSYKVRVRSTDETNRVIELPYIITITDDDPMLELSARTLTVSGGAGNDAFSFSPGTPQDSLTLNGVALAVDAAAVDAVVFNGGGGTDTATLFAGGGANTLNLAPGGGSLSGTGYKVTVNAVAQVVATGHAGDRANLTGSAGADVFVGTPTYAYLYGAGYFNQANGFGVVLAAGAGGSDNAYLYDGPGNDVFLGTPTYAYLYGSGFFNQANGFKVVVGNASSGTDYAYLYGAAAGGNVFVGTPTYAYLYGGGFFNQADGFKVVVGNGAGAGNQAYLYGAAAGGNVFVATSAYSYLYGTGFFNQANGFQTVVGTAAGPGDSAYLYDTPGGLYVATSTYAYVSGSGLVEQANGFASVYAYSGGGDTAYLYGTLTAADTFVDAGGYAYLFGPGFLVLESGFATVWANPFARR